MHTNKNIVYFSVLKAMFHDISKKNTELALPV